MSDGLEFLLECAPHGEIPSLGEVNPYSIGVTSSAFGNPHLHGQMDPYVPRTANDVDGRIRDALQEGKFTVVVGPSKSGKSRTAHQIVSEKFKDSLLVVPIPGKLSQLCQHPSIRDSSETLVFWFDDLDRFLESTDSLTPKILELISDRPGQTKFIGTIRAEARVRLLAGDSVPQERGSFAHSTILSPRSVPSDRESIAKPSNSECETEDEPDIVQQHFTSPDKRQVRKLFDAAAFIPLESTSKDEKERAAAEAAYPNLESKYGLAESLSGVPALRSLYSDLRLCADPVNTLHYLTIRTAIDWTRCGRIDPIPEDVLAHHVRDWIREEFPSVDVRPSAILEAIRWAKDQRPSDGVIPVFESYRLDDSTRGYWPASDLVSLDDERRIPSLAWDHALTGADSDAAYRVANTAFRRNYIEAASNAADIGAAGGVEDAMILLGYLLEKRVETPDKAAAITWYRKAAERGSVLGMTNAAICLSSIPQGTKEAAKWYTLAAETTGDPTAMHNLADFLCRVDVDRPAEGIEWLEKAAKAGDPAAALHLANELLHQKPPKLERARALYEQVAATGNTDGNVGIGHILVHHVEPLDIPSAVAEFNVAINAGNDNGRIGLADLYARHLKKPDISKARKLYSRAAASGSGRSAREYAKFLAYVIQPPRIGEACAKLQDHVDNGDRDSMVLMGNLLITTGGEDDRLKGLDLLVRASDKLSAHAMCTLGRYYLEMFQSTAEIAPVRPSGKRSLFRRLIAPRRASPTAGSSTNIDLAIDWFTKSAQQGHAHAMSWLGYIFLAVHPDRGMARGWLTQAASKGDAYAQYELASLLWSQWQPPQVEEAIHWYQTAAEGSGDTDAMYRLGELYHRGQTDEALETSMRWYTTAAQRGHVPSMVDLARIYETEYSDRLEAKQWYRSAAIAGDAEAMRSLADLLAESVHKSDLKEANSWYERAAKAGDGAAMIYVGDFVLSSGRKGAVSSAVYWYSRAADLGYTEALVKWADVLAESRSGKDRELALKLYKDAASSGWHEDLSGCTNIVID